MYGLLLPREAKWSEVVRKHHFRTGVTERGVLRAFVPSWSILFWLEHNCLRSTTCTLQRKANDLYEINVDISYSLFFSLSVLAFYDLKINF